MDLLLHVAPLVSDRRARAPPEGSGWILPVLERGAASHVVWSTLPMGRILLQRQGRLLLHQMSVEHRDHVTFRHSSPPHDATRSSITRRCLGSPACARGGVLA